MSTLPEKSREHVLPQSPYPGVTWCSYHQKWRARLPINGQLTHVGYFDDDREAHDACVITMETGEAPRRRKPSQATVRRAAPVSISCSSSGLRWIPDYARPGQWIVWRPGALGECELVNAQRCTCNHFAEVGRCEHHALLFGGEAQAA